MIDFSYIDMKNMNIFFLSMSIKRCARAHFDKHVVKMIVEMTQLLSTCFHLVEPIAAQLLLEQQLIYRKTHVHHPCVKFVTQHMNNYDYVVRLGLELCHVWRSRYNHQKIHGCESKLIFLNQHRPSLPNHIIIKTSHNPKCLQLPLPQAMPAECRRKGNVHACVMAYRTYYKSTHKAHLVSWTMKEEKEKKQLDKPLWW